MHFIDNITPGKNCYLFKQIGVRIKLPCPDKSYKNKLFLKFVQLKSNSVEMGSDKMLYTDRVCSELVVWLYSVVLFLFKIGRFGLNIGLKSYFVVTHVWVDMLHYL